MTPRARLGWPNALVLGQGPRFGATSPLRVLHEAPCHLIPRLVDGPDSLDELRGPAASQTGRGDHAIADIGVDTAHQECADRAEIPALVLDGCAKGFTFAELSCRERACKTDLDDADVLAFVADPMIAVGRWRRRARVVLRFRQMQTQLPHRQCGCQMSRPFRQPGPESLAGPAVQMQMQPVQPVRPVAYAVGFAINQRM